VRRDQDPDVPKADMLDKKVGDSSDVDDACACSGACSALPVQRTSEHR
jgi:hypothetical protein